MRKAARVVAVAAAALLLAGCSGGSDEPGAIGAPSEPTEDATADPDPPEETEPEDPYAIPDEIDEAYVQSVVSVLLRVPDDAELEAYRTGPHNFPPDDLIAAVRATYSPQLSVEQLTSHANDLIDDAKVAERLEHLESRPTEGWTVRELEHADEDCVIVAFDYPEGGSSEVGRAVLLAGYEDRDTDELNPTPWVLDRHGPTSLFAEGELEDRCTAEQLEDEDAIGEEQDA